MLPMLGGLYGLAGWFFYRVLVWATEEEADRNGWNTTSHDRPFAFFCAALWPIGVLTWLATSWYVSRHRTR